MYILLGSHGFPPQQSTGAEWRTYRMARWLNAHGHLAQVLAIDRTDQTIGATTLTDERVDGIRVRRLSYSLKQAGGSLAEYNNPIVQQTLSDLLAYEQPDVFHLISGYRMTGSAIEAAHIAHVPIVVTLTDFWFLCPRITLRRRTGELCTVPEDVLDCAVCLLNDQRRYRLPHTLTRGLTSRLLKGLWRWTQFAGYSIPRQLHAAMIDRRRFLGQALNQADKLIAPSKFLADLFNAQGIDSRKIIVTRQGVDLAPTLLERIHLPDKPLTFGYIGQLAAHKGLHILVKAFRQLPFDATRIKLVIYGDPAQAWPPFLAQLEQTIGGDQRIVLAGQFVNSEIRKVHYDLDVLVVPSIWYENSPNVILEAFACGTPVMASKLGGMAELIEHEVNGLLFEPDHIASLKDALERVISNPDQLMLWRRQIPQVKTTTEEMIELETIYADILPSK